MKKVVISLRHAHENNPKDYSAAIIYWYGILDRMGYEVKYYELSFYLKKEKALVVNITMGPVPLKS